VIPGVAAALLCLGLSPDPARAGAWPLKSGETLIIAKYERQTADEGFDPEGRRVAIDRRSDETASVYVERGLTSRLTLQARLAATRGEDLFVAYDGRGPLELGLRYAVLRSDRSAVSLYVGAIEGGVGRNAGYAAPGAGELDLEARVLVGRSGRWRGRDVYGEVQIAHVSREGLADEVRVDTTLGVRPRSGWLVLAQTYAGEARDAPIPSRWVKAELSVVRQLGPWAVQAGWRDTLAGREAPADRGPVLAVWRRF